MSIARGAPAVVGVTLLDARLDASQWFGAATVVTAVLALALHEQRRRRPAVETPDEVEAAWQRSGQIPRTARAAEALQCGQDARLGR